MPSEELLGAVKLLSNINLKSCTPQAVYVIEECAELTEELLKMANFNGNKDDLCGEAADVLSTTFVLLYQLGISPEYAKSYIMGKVPGSVTIEDCAANLYKSSELGTRRQKEHTVSACARLTQQLTKYIRRKGERKDLIECAFDAIIESFVLLYHFKMPHDFVTNHIAAKAKRAQERCEQQEF